MIEVMSRLEMWPESPGAGRAKSEGGGTLPVYRAVCAGFQPPGPKP